MSSSTFPADRRCLNCELRLSRIFCNLSNAAFEHFIEIGQHVTLPEKRMVFRDGAAADGIFLVCAGEVKLSTMSANGRMMFLKIAGPGEILGLSAILNLRTYEATAITCRQSGFKYIRRSAFLTFMRTHAEVGVNVASILAREHTEILLAARRLALSPSASSRIAHALIEFSKTALEPGPSFTMHLTHEELAGVVGTSRETVTRMLNQFERDGLISRGGSVTTILRASEFSSLAQ